MNEADKKEINVNLSEMVRGGVYSNNLAVSHTKEEFIMDFMMVAPPGGTVNARVITSPGHMKRILKALSDNIQKYEKAYGKIEEAQEPHGSKPIGFQPG